MLLFFIQSCCTHNILSFSKMGVFVQSNWIYWSIFLHKPKPNSMINVLYVLLLCGYIPLNILHWYLYSSTWQAPKDDFGWVSMELCLTKSFVSDMATAKDMWDAHTGCTHTGLCSWCWKTFTVVLLLRIHHLEHFDVQNCVLWILFKTVIKLFM